MTVGFINAEYNKIWNDMETFEWGEFDYGMLEKKENSKSKLLMAMFSSSFSVINTLKEDVLFAIASTPIVGLVVKNQTIVGTEIIRRIPGWVFGLASGLACVLRINAIIENNKELLQMNNNAVKLLEFLDKMPRFNEFRDTDYFVNMLESDIGIHSVLDFDVVDEFYKFRNKEMSVSG